MKNILKSNILLLSFVLFSLAGTTFWALTTNRCLEIKSKQIEIKAACYSNAEKAKE